MLKGFQFLNSAPEIPHLHHRKTEKQTSALWVGGGGWRRDRQRDKQRQRQRNYMCFRGGWISRYSFRSLKHFTQNIFKTNSPLLCTSVLRKENLNRMPYFKEGEQGNYKKQKRKKDAQSDKRQNNWQKEIQKVTGTVFLHTRLRHQRVGQIWLRALSHSPPTLLGWCYFFVRVSPGSG